jgi:hypothetical protein
MHALDGFAGTWTDLPWPLNLGNSNHQIGHGRPRRLSFEQDLIELGRDRHLDAAPECERMDATGRRHTFGNVDHPSEHLIERFPAADPLADRAIAAIRTVTGRDNVAHTRQAVKRLVSCAQVDAQSGDFDQPARQ